VRRSTTENYYHDGGCPLEDCERLYCSEHKLLYRACDTAQPGTEGDRDVVNGTRTVWETDGECPKCAQKARRLQYEREIVARAWHEVGAH
jgi:hypothetical protein